MSRRKSTTTRVRIDDVAAAAGVSIMTVSRALRGVEGVSETRREQIVALAQQMRYTPNSNARSLVGEQSALIGISFPILFNDVFADILEGMRGAFDAAGFATVVNITDYQREREHAWVERVLTWRPAAMVLTGVDHDPAVVARLRENRIPTLEVWDFHRDPIDICVGIDHEKAGYDIARAVRARGYERPAYVGFAKGYDLRSEARLAGLRRAFGDADVYDGGKRRAGDDEPDDRSAPADQGGQIVQVARPRAASPYESGHAGFRQLWAQRDRRPDVVFFLSDHLAFGGLMACQAAGIDVPGDVGLVGFNGLSITTVLPRKLTTVITPRRRMGTLGASCLIARINGVKSDLSAELQAQVVLGETTR